MFSRQIRITMILLATLLLLNLLPLSLLAQPTQPSQSDEVLEVGLTTGWSLLDPIFGTGPGGPDRWVYNMIFEALLRKNLDGSFTPMLAERYEFSEDGLQITFYLREGVLFHDGTPFDAAAAAFNLNRVIDPAVGSPRASAVAQMSSAEAVDSRTVVVTLSQPSAVILTALATEPGMMVSPSALTELGEDFALRPVGTGPFRVKEFVVDDHLTLERFGDYWRTDDNGVQFPYLAGVNIRFIPDASVRQIELATGNVDLIANVTPIEFAGIEADPNLQLIRSPQTIHQYITFNVTQPPFDNEVLRKAVLYALDRQLLSDIITFGYGSITPTLIPSSEWIYDDGVMAYTYDPLQVQAYLEEAGFADGFSFTLSHIARDPDNQVAQIIQETLREVGIDVVIESLERQLWLDKVLNYGYEAAMLGINVPRTDPDLVFGTTFGRNAAQNWAGIEDEELFEVVEQARVELDASKRRDLYVTAQELLQERGYYAFLFHRPVAYPASAKLQNFTMDVDGAWRLGEVWLTD